VVASFVLNDAHNAALPGFETLDDGLARAAKLLKILAHLLS
jgi:hypothetical protein